MSDLHASYWMFIVSISETIEYFISNYTILQHGKRMIHWIKTSFGKIKNILAFDAHSSDEKQLGTCSHCDDSDLTRNPTKTISLQKLIWEDKF